MAGNRLFTEPRLLYHLVVQISRQLFHHIVIGPVPRRKDFIYFRHDYKLEKAPG